MTVTIDGNNISDLDGFYDEIEKHLDKGECPWGRNLDSLDEIVQSNFNYTDNPEFDVKEIVWLNAKTSEEKLGLDETVKWLTRKFDYNLDNKYQDGLKNKIELVKNKSVQTLFDIIIELFESNANIKLIMK